MRYATCRKPMKRRSVEIPATNPVPETQNPHESAIFAAELGEATELDLHGQDVNLAVSQLDQFINHEFVAGTDVVKIIHGRGTGKLRDAIHAWLKKHPQMVAYFRDARGPSQQGGVTFAALHRPR